MNRYRTSAVITLAMSLAACSGSGSGPMGTPVASSPSQATVVHKQDTQGGLPRMTSAMSVALGDAAPRLGSIVPTKILIAVKEVDAVRDDGTLMMVQQFNKPVVVDVLAHQDDPGTISVGQVGVGKYDYLRFLIDTTQSQVVAGHNKYPITFQTGAPTQSSFNAGVNSNTTQIDPTTIAMTAPGNFMVGGIVANEVEADFNAFESLNVDASGNVFARPTLFAAPSKVSGKVQGHIINENGDPVSGATIVLTDLLGNVANTDNTDADGKFSMHTIPAGVYNVYVLNQYTTASGQTVAASGESADAGPGENIGTITVSANKKTKLGRIQD